MKQWRGHILRLSEGKRVFIIKLNFNPEIRQCNPKVAQRTYPPKKQKEMLVVDTGKKTKS